MPKLIINADDFGMSRGICEAILACSEVCAHLSTSVMTCAPGSRELAALYLRRFKGCIGVHLQLSAGSPMLDGLKVPSLVGPDGLFATDEQRDQQNVSFAAEVREEWSAQARALHCEGIVVNHIDTHQNMHSLPVLWSTYADIAEQFGLRARGGVPKLTAFLRDRRIAGPDISVRFWRLEPTLDALCEELERYLKIGHGKITQDLPVAVRELAVEVVCHPGLPDRHSSLSPSEVERRRREYEIFSDVRTYRRFQECGWLLASYNSLKFPA
jgi:chitin disaccharide deacetylase